MTEVADQIAFNGSAEVGHDLELFQELVPELDAFGMRLVGGFGKLPCFLRGAAVAGKFGIAETFAEEVDAFERKRISFGAFSRSVEDGVGFDKEFGGVEFSRNRKEVVITAADIAEAVRVVGAQLAELFLGDCGTEIFPESDIFTDFFVNG